MLIDSDKRIWMAYIARRKDTSQHGHSSLGGPHFTFTDTAMKENSLKSVDVIWTVVLDRDVSRGVAAPQAEESTEVNK
jgi:hypothetical protein